MPLQERVTGYSVSLFKNDITNYNQVLRLTTETGHQAFVAFPDIAPDQWLTISGTNTTAYLPRSEFDRIHHLLQSESPLYLSAIELFGIRAFNVVTASELPGDGLADDAALVEFMAKVREHYGTREKAASG